MGTEAASVIECNWVAVYEREYKYVWYNLT